MKALLLSTALVLTAAARAQAPPEAILKTEVTPRGREICIGCNKPIASGDKVYLVEGQRVPVHVSHCEDAVRADPLRFLAALKPRGGLFGGETAPSGAVTDAWLLFGGYVLLGLVFSAVCAHRALNTGRSAIPWFFAGLLFNAFGYLALLTRPPLAARIATRYAGVTKIPTTAEPRACPRCGAANHPAAAFCSGCGATLQPAMESEVARARSS